MRELCNKIVNIEFEKIFDIWRDNVSLQMSILSN